MQSKGKWPGTLVVSQTLVTGKEAFSVGENPTVFLVEIRSKTGWTRRHRNVVLPLVSA